MGKCGQGKPNTNTPSILICDISNIGCELSERDDSDQCPLFLDYHLRIEGKK